MFALYIDRRLACHGSRSFVLDQAFDFVYGSGRPYENRSRVIITFYDGREVI